MKRILLSLLGFPFLIACGNSNRWSAGEEKIFMDQCVGAAEKKSNSEVAKKYCDCMLQKLEKTYSSYKKANLALGTDQGKMQEMAMECKP